MGYKYYRIYLVALILGSMALSGLLTCAWLFRWGFSLWLPLLLLLLFIVNKLWKTILYPLKHVSFFLSALQCRERMIRFPSSRDKLLQRVGQQMNNIIRLYGDNQQEIETKKNYYDRILRIVAHEIRNTVTPIISLSGFYLQKDLSHYPPEKIREGLQLILSQSMNVRDFLDSYHTLTHLPEPKMERIALRPFCEDMFRVLRNEPGGDTIALYVPDMYLMADGTMLQLILGNLLRNALQATQECVDGAIELRASISERQPYISVTDNGEGIAEDRMSNIFLPFYSTKKSGSGIGLCLSRQMMRLLGGDLTVVSRPANRVTTFTLTFPPLLRQ